MITVIRPDVRPQATSCESDTGIALRKAVRIQTAVR